MLHERVGIAVERYGRVFTAEDFGERLYTMPHSKARAVFSGVMQDFVGRSGRKRAFRMRTLRKDLFLRWLSRSKTTKRNAGTG